MTNRRMTPMLALALALALLVGACGDDDYGGSDTGYEDHSFEEDSSYSYEVDEIIHGDDVYLCINNVTTRGMWCENTTGAGDG